MSAQPHLQIENLSKAYDETLAVKGFNLDVAEGELICLLGPSGCGKTTTLRLVAGFVAATTGRILVEGKDYNPLPPFQREMGMVFQSYALFPHMTVAQNITFGLRMRKMSADETRRRLEETLELVKLGALADRYPRQLSGGQQQRVALARALAIRPKVLLLDEPLSNLDANLRFAVAREIRKLQKAAGLTALMVTHDQDEAMTMADRLVLMKDGEVQQIGSQEDLYERPKNPFVAKFIGHSNLVQGDLADGDGLRLPGGATISLTQAYTGRGSHTLALRPERIRFWDPASSTQKARLTVTIDDVIYVGNHIDYQLALPGGGNLSLRESTADALKKDRRPIGAQADITWDSNNERLFDEQGKALFSN